MTYLNYFESIKNDTSFEMYNKSYESLTMRQSDNVNDAIANDYMSWDQETLTVEVCLEDRYDEFKL